MLANLQCTFHGIYTTCTELETTLQSSLPEERKPRSGAQMATRGISPNTDHSEGIFRPEKLTPQLDRTAFVPHAELSWPFNPPTPTEKGRANRNPSSVGTRAAPPRPTDSSFFYLSLTTKPPSGLTR